MSNVHLCLRRLRLKYATVPASGPHTTPPASHHNYYMGRAEADLTAWIEYFVALLAQVFAEARDEALRHTGKGLPHQPPELRSLDRRARTVLALFAQKDRITAQDVAAALG